VFERFSEPARQVVVLAQDEARALGHNYIGTEHLLLGLLREREGLGARVLESLGVAPEAARDEVARIVGMGDIVATGQIPFTPRAKKVLELSLREALALGHDYIGTEHVLLGLVAEGEGVGARILASLGGAGVREAVVAALSGETQIPEYKPSVPPVAEEVVAEIETLSADWQRAVDEQRFDDAAVAQSRRRSLIRAARDLERAWRDEPMATELPAAELSEIRGRRVHLRRMPRGFSSYGPSPRDARATLVLGWLLFASALAVGLVVGWAIWS